MYKHITIIRYYFLDCGKEKEKRQTLPKMYLNKLYLRCSFHSYSIDSFIQIMSCKVVSQSDIENTFFRLQLTVH